MSIAGNVIIAQPLPAVRGTAVGDYYPVGASGQSTSNVRPPRTIASFPANTFQQALTSPALQRALTVRLYPVETERSHRLASEGDIERAAALYLVHHVCLIIERGLIPHIRGVDVDDFECLGQTTTGNARPDISFVVKGRPVLILEYKHANSLKEEDWTNSALVGKDGRTALDIINNIRPGVRTALEGNAGVISQCSLVVISNYQNMIVLDFAPGGRAADDLTNPVQYFWSYGNVLTHKQLLIAAFIYGLRKANFLGQNA